MGWVLLWQAAAHDLAQAPASPNQPDAMTYKVIIGAMGGFILLLIAWIKSLIAENKELQKERVGDLKDQIKSAKDD